MTARPRSDDSISESVVELTPEEVERAFDAESRASLGISAEEFRRRWQRGEYAGQDTEAVWRVAFFLGGLAPKQ
jgi:hypothetical protein